MTDDPAISRRAMLLGRLGRSAEPTGALAPAPPPSAPRLLRPPGAVDEAKLIRDCTRCDECAAACPVDAIVFADRRHGAAEGTPYIDPGRAPCIMCADTPCISACEPNVLSLDAPIAMGTAHIKAPNCIAFGPMTCTVCSERCPVEGAIKVENGRPRIVESACTGCGVCQFVCPAPHPAVMVLPRGEAEEPAPPLVEGRFDWRAAYLGK